MPVYNTQKDKLRIREYGRNTQNLIHKAKEIQDREERKAYIEKIVDMIITMYPNSKNVDDYRIIIWSHVFQIADYDLDIDKPDDFPDPRNKRKADVLPYPQKSRRMRHYGKTIQKMIDKAIEMKDEEKRNEFLEVIVSFMKMSYIQWNRDNVSDEVIAEEFVKISKGALEIPQGLNFDLLESSHSRISSNARTNNNNKNRSNRKNIKSKHQRNRNFSKNKNRKKTI